MKLREFADVLCRFLDHLDLKEDAEVVFKAGGHVVQPIDISFSSSFTPDDRGVLTTVSDFDIEHEVCIWVKAP